MSLALDGCAALALRTLPALLAGLLDGAFPEKEGVFGVKRVASRAERDARADWENNRRARGIMDVVSEQNQVRYDIAEKIEGKGAG